MAVDKKKKYDEVTVMRDRNKKKRRTHLWIILAALGAAAVIISALAFNMRGFSSYKEVGSEAVKTDEPGAVYISYKDGYIRSSHSGAEYVDASGKTRWNEPMTFADPKPMVYGDKIFIADIGGNSVDIFDASGHTGKVETPYSIYEAAGTPDGKVAIMTQDNNVNYLELYEKNGEPVYSVKTSLSGEGYPIAFDITRDGKKLALSYVKAEKKPIETGVRFYDFSGKSDSDRNRVVGEFSDFDGELTGDMVFFDNGNACAVSESSLKFYFSEANGMSLKTEHELFEDYDGTVKRVLRSGERIALIVSTADDEAPERLIVFSENGRQLCDEGLEQSYDRYTLEGNQVYMMSSNRFAIYTTSGKEITKQESDRPVSTLISNGGSEYFLVSGSGEVRKIKLS